MIRRCDLDSARFALLTTLTACPHVGIRELSSATERGPMGGPTDLAVLELHVDALRSLLADRLVVAKRMEGTVQLKITPAGRRARAAHMTGGSLPARFLAAVTAVGFIIACAHPTVPTTGQVEQGVAIHLPVVPQSSGPLSGSVSARCIGQGCLSVKTSVSNGYYDNVMVSDSSGLDTGAPISATKVDVPAALQETIPSRAESSRGISLSVSFRFATASLGKLARRAIQDMRTQALMARSIVVRGATDAIGDRSANQRLAVTRAESVSEELVKLGVAPEVIRVEGCVDCFVASNMTPLGRSANRRADIVFFGAADKSPLR